MNDLSKALEETINSENISKIEDSLYPLLIENADELLSTILKDNVLSEIPIIKTINTIGKVFGGINQYLLAEKIIIFLFQIKDININERKDFLLKLNGAQKQEILGQLVVVLDKHDRFIKSEIQGQLFKGLILGVIRIKEYLSLTHSVNQIDAELLDSVKIFYTSETGKGYFSDSDIYSMASLRLIGIDNSTIGTYNGGGPIYRRNRLGIFLVTVGMNTKIPFDYVESTIGDIEAKSLYEKLKF